MADHSPTPPPLPEASPRAGVLRELALLLGGGAALVLLAFQLDEPTSDHRVAEERPGASSAAAHP